MSHAYRSEYQHVVGKRIAEMRAASELVEPMMPKLRSIRAARIARALAGGVGILGTALMCIVALTDLRDELTYTLLGSLGAAIATYVVARLVMAFGGLVRHRFFRRGDDDAASHALPELTGNLGADLERLESANAFRTIEQKLSRVELLSTSLPLIALSLLMPLSLHWLFVQVMGTESASGFAGWIRISLVVVGHAHLALAFMGYRFAKKLRMLPADAIAQMSVNREWAKAWGIAIGVSCIPFILLFAVPPILVALTGIVFIPAMFALVRHRLMMERSTIAQADEASTVRARVAIDDDTKMFGEASWTDMMNPRLIGAAAAPETEAAGNAKNIPLKAHAFDPR